MSEMMRRLAEADALPTETDAPELSGEGAIPYDTALQADLMEYGPDALKQYGRIVVRDVANAARYNSAIWYALGNDLVYEYDGETVTITDPKAAA